MDRQTYEKLLRQAESCQGSLVSLTSFLRMVLRGQVVGTQFETLAIVKELCLRFGLKVEALLETIDPEEPTNPRDLN